MRLFLRCFNKDFDRIRKPKLVWSLALPSHHSITWENSSILSLCRESALSTWKQGWAGSNRVGILYLHYPGFCPANFLRIHNTKLLRITSKQIILFWSECFYRTWIQALTKEAHLELLLNSFFIRILRLALKVLTSLDWKRLQYTVEMMLNSRLLIVGKYYILGDSLFEDNTRILSLYSHLLPPPPSPQLKLKTKKWKGNLSIPEKHLKYLHILKRRRCFYELLCPPLVWN